MSNKMRLASSQPRTHDRGVAWARATCLAYLATQWPKKEERTTEAPNKQDGQWDIQKWHWSERHVCLFPPFVSSDSFNLKVICIVKLNKRQVDFMYYEMLHNLHINQCHLILFLIFQLRWPVTPNLMRRLISCPLSSPNRGQRSDSQVRLPTVIMLWVVIVT